MKEIIKKPTKEQEAQEKRIAEEEKQKKLALAKAKKEEMLRLEEEKKKKLPVDEFEKEKQDKRKMVNDRAVEYNNEHLDEVKEMNKMVTYAKVATIRERQLEEKKSEWDHFKDKEKKKDLIMEVERLKKIEEQDEIEERKKW